MCAAAACIFSCFILLAHAHQVCGAVSGKLADTSLTTLALICLWPCSAGSRYLAMVVAATEARGGSYALPWRPEEEEALLRSDQWLPCRRQRPPSSTDQLTPKATAPDLEHELGNLAPTYAAAGQISPYFGLEIFGRNSCLIAQNHLSNGNIQRSFSVYELYWKQQRIWNSQ
ncbi:hypothetical protein VPH35_085831 [Triticum aestivum]